MTQTTETTTYLREIEAESYDSLSHRKKLQSWLLFISCQVSSASLALWLFQLSANLVAVYCLSSFVALLPGLLDASGAIAITSKKEWEVSTNLETIAKLVAGGATAVAVNYQVWSRVQSTREGIEHSYKIIRKHNPYLEVFNAVLPLVIVAAAVLGLLTWRFKK
jgi:hypothetical protein